MKNWLVKLGGIAMAVAIALSLGSVSEAASYTVVKGDNLWNIAKDKLGDGKRYGEIYEANKDQIKDPAKIQIGQVLEIPDTVSSATTEKPEEVEEIEVITPNPDPEPEETETVTSFSQAVSEGLPGAIEALKTLKADEKKTLELEYSTSNMYKTKGGVLVVDSIVDLETAKNSRVVNFLYEHKDAYQMVVYLTHKKGEKTILVFNVSADGKENKVIYASTDNNETADTEMNLSDLVAGGDGKIKITSTKDEKTGITNKVSEIIIGDAPVRTSYIQVKEDKNAKTVNANSLNEDKSEITKLLFDTTYNSGKETEVVTITDVEGTGELSFDSNKDGVVASSAKYVAKAGMGDIIEQRNADLVATLEEFKVGKEIKVNYNGAEQFLKKVTDDAVYSETKPENGNNVTDIVFKYGKGYLKLDMADFVKEGISAVSLLSIKKDGSSVPLYYSTTDDTVGEKTTELATAGSEKVELKTKTTENKDKSRTKDVQVIMDGKVVLTSKVEISADGNKVETVSKIDKEETKLSFVVDGKTVKTTISSKDGECVLSYDRDDDKNILYDTIKVEAK